MHCDFAHGSTRFDSVCLDGEEPTRVSGNFIHPHIQGASACWGQYAEVMSNLYKSNDINGILATVVDFLRHYYEGDWYRSCAHFMTQCEMEKMGITCERCESIHGCECEDWCHDCDNHQDECNCNYKCAVVRF